MGYEDRLGRGEEPGFGLSCCLRASGRGMPSSQLPVTLRDRAVPRVNCPGLWGVSPHLPPPPPGNRRDGKNHVFRFNHPEQARLGAGSEVLHPQDRPSEPVGLELCPEGTAGAARHRISSWRWEKRWRGGGVIRPQTLLAIPPRPSAPSILPLLDAPLRWPGTSWLCLPPTQLQASGSGEPVQKGKGRG